MSIAPSSQSPLLHAGRALFAAVTGDEARLRTELLLLCAHDDDGRHRRWAYDEGAFAPFHQRAWFLDLIGPTGSGWPALVLR